MGLERSAPGDQITYKIFNLTVDIPVPVMGALLYDPERQIPCMGFACRFDPHDAVPAAEPGASSLDHLVAILAERNLECIYVDLTTPDMKDAGLSVVRVLVPGMVPNAPTAFPFLGPRGLYEVPVTMGWAGRPLTEAELNLAPLPHS